LMKSLIHILLKAKWLIV